MMGQEAVVPAAKGRLPEAAKLTRDWINISRRVLGPDYAGTGVNIYNLGCIAAHRGDRSKALSLLR